MCGLGLISVSVRFTKFLL